MTSSLAKSSCLAKEMVKKKIIFEKRTLPFKEPNLTTFLNLHWGLKEGLLGYPFGTVDYGKAPVGGSQYGEAPTRGPTPNIFLYHL